VHEVDDPQRAALLRERLQGKAFLRRLYLETYGRYAACLARCPGEGLVVELGSGAGFAKDVLPEIVTSDVVPYPGVDRVVDATQMPFPARSVRALFLLNVFHHVPDVDAFLSEAERCLVPGGRLLVVDQHPGWISGPILRHVHHEPFDPAARDWQFASSGPLSGANGALTWMVFRRDVERLRRTHPGLTLVRYAPHTPLRYWMSGGLKSWSLVPGWMFPFATWVDRSLTRVSESFASFVDVELVRGR
jgi:SAM-dependent methyltransferase